MIKYLRGDIMELLDVYDDLGNVTGRTVVRGDKSVKLNEHEHIAVAIIFIENDKGEFLIQKTSKEKGNVFGVTGGHIDVNEDKESALLREVKEEIGLNLDMSEVKYLGHIVTGVPIRFLYYLKKDIDLNDFVLDPEEVDSVRYMEVNEILNFIEEDLFIESHGICFNKILEFKKKNII